jgi:hypothetical protein
MTEVEQRRQVAQLITPHVPLQHFRFKLSFSGRVVVDSEGKIMTL